MILIDIIELLLGLLLCAVGAVYLIFSLYIMYLDLRNK